MTLKLPTAHTVLKESLNDAKHVVLVHMPTEVCQFATYRVDSDGACYWGHYTQSLDEALADYNERV